MKSSGTICLCLLWALTAHAELDTLWTARLALDPASYMADGAVLLQNGETMVTSARPNSGFIDLWRLSNTGEIVWQGNFTLPALYPRVLGIVQMDEGHVVVLCAYESAGDIGATLVAKGISLTGVDISEHSFQYGALPQAAGVRKLRDNTIAVYMTTYDMSTVAAPTLIKMSSDGDTLWTQNVGPQGDVIEARDVVELSNGDLVVAGQFMDETFIFSGYVMRTGATGDPVWTQTFIDEIGFGMICSSLDVDHNDNILVGGMFGNPWTLNNMWAKNLTSAGDEIWSLSGVGSANCMLSGIGFHRDGAIIVGTGGTGFDPNHIRVYSVNSSGEGMLETEFPEAYSYLAKMVNSGSRGAIAFGAVMEANWEYRGLVMRFKPGTLVTGLIRELGSNQPVVDARVEMIETGEFAFTDVQGIYSLGVSEVSGTLRVTSPCIMPAQQTVELIEGTENVADFHVGVPLFQNGVSSLNMVATFGIPERDTIVVNNFGNGDLIFSATAHEQNPTYGWLSANPASGSIPPGESREIIVSVLANAEHPDAEFFGEVRIHHNSCPDTVDEIGVYVLALDSPEQPTLVESFALHPAYPNPFNNTARVAFDLLQTAQVSAKLYSIEGREAATLADAQYTAGRHELTINGDALATGVYLLRLTAGSAVATQKLVLLK